MTVRFRIVRFGIESSYGVAVRRVHGHPSGSVVGF